MFQMTTTAWKNILGTMPVQLQKWHQCDLARPGWLFQTSKTTAAWWLTSNSRSMPLAMKYQIQNQDSRQVAMSGFAESPAAGGRYEVLSSHEKNTLPFNEFFSWVLDHAFPMWRGPWSMSEVSMWVYSESIFFEKSVVGIGCVVTESQHRIRHLQHCL